MVFTDLKGIWKVIEDKDMLLTSWNENEWEKHGFELTLPGTVNNGKIGERQAEVSVEHLTDEYEFVGNVWYYRKFELSEDCTDKEVIFHIEKTRISTVYIDGEKTDTLDSLCTPHNHVIKGGLKKGVHNIAVCVNNTRYKTKGGHMTSPDTQTNWNGMLGRIGLKIFEKEHIDKLQVYSVRTGEKSAYITAVAYTTLSEGEVLFKITPKSGEGLLGMVVAVNDPVTGCSPISDDGSAVFSAEINGDNLFWDEYDRNLFTCEAILVNGEKADTVFGIRTFEAGPMTLKINGRELFLRGKHDGMVFPLTGFAPMDKKSWKKVFKTAKEYGINHYRFHTCCPPAAAFDAADEEGIYLAPELPFWGTVHEEGEEGYNKEEQEYLIEEGKQILDTYGNHPSFMMMSLGNELWGSHKKIGEILDTYKKQDPRHLYTGGSNNFQFYPTTQENEDVFVGVRFSRERLIRGSYAMCDAPLGYVQTDMPRCDKNYDSEIEPAVIKAGDAAGDEYIEIQYGTGVKKVKAGESNEIMSPVTPVIAHETGQYYFYPDFESEEKYTGNLKATYLSAYRDNLVKNGLYEKHREFYKAAGKHAVNCYRADIEAMMLSKKLSGFQMLDLQDFPGQDIALVGILDAFLDNKGFVTPEKWREFCSDNVVYICLPKFAYTAGDVIEADINIITDRYEHITDASCTVRLTDATGYILDTMTLSGCGITERVNNTGKVTFKAPSKTDKYILKAECVLNSSYGKHTVKSSREIWIYENIDIEITNEFISQGEKKTFITHDFADALKLKGEGKSVICIPEKGEDDIEGTYCTDFWNYSMFSKISESLGRPVPVGTLGLYSEKSPYLDGFTNDGYTTPQWYNIVTHSHAINLENGGGENIITWVIDNPVRAKRLALLYEKEGIIVCSSRLWEIKDEPEVKAFALGLLNNLSKQDGTK